VNVSPWRSGRYLYSLWRNLNRRLVLEFEAEQVGAFPVIEVVAT
jgi:hypothetical protein